MEASIDSQMSWLLSLPEQKRRKAIAKLSEGSRNAMWEWLKEWPRFARKKQLPPKGDWFYWLIQAGRGWGKTRTAIEFIRSKLDAGEWRTVNCAGPTWMDVMDTMVHGSVAAIGLMDAWPPHKKPTLHMGSNPHLKTWNGGIIRLRAAKEAERFRGTQAEGGWVDEIDSWAPNRMKPKEALALFELGIRLGNDPRIVATSTPKRGRLVARLLKRKDVKVTRGHMKENRRNLSSRFLQVMEEQYGGTSFGRQELGGDLLDEIDGAIISHDQIEALRVDESEIPTLKQIVVGVDPTGGAAEAGILTCGYGADGHGYVLEDHSGHYTPEGWATRAVDAYYNHRADRIVAEINYGGAMVEGNIRTVDKKVPVKVVSATRGKQRRFQPVGSLIEQGKIHFVGSFPRLEDEITCFTLDDYEGEDSPNRADAFVWSITDMMIGKGRTRIHVG